jgi:DNA-binding Lrp family transcriptional regulator
MTYQLDEIDRRILHALMMDARNTSAPAIAEDLDVSAGTVRYRIDQLEQEGVIQGYTAVLDFERAGHLASVFMCTVPTDSREELALAARSIPGVMGVRVLMAGRRDLQIVAVGETTEDLREIARSLAEFDIEIENEKLLQTEIRSSHERIPPETPSDSPMNEVVTLADGTPVVEVHVTEEASIAGMSLDAAKHREILPGSATVVSVERDGRIIQPTAKTAIESGDIVTVVAREECKEELRGAFTPGPDPGDRALPR